MSLTGPLTAMSGLDLWPKTRGACIWIIVALTNLIKRQIPLRVHGTKFRGFFVCFCGFFHPNRELFTHIETSPLPAKGCKFFTFIRHSWPLGSEASFCVPLMWHGIYDNNGLFRGPVTLTPVTGCFNNLGLSNTQPSTCEANALTDCATAAAA